MPEPPRPPQWTREDLVGAETSVLHEGRWGNANILRIERGGERWIVKDFQPRPAAIRHLWGVPMVRRELRALRLLEGLEGVPESPFEFDRFAFGYRFIEGTTLRRIEPRLVTTRYFEELEALIRAMHLRGIAHLDLRNKRNVLVTPEGRPAILDFQSAIRLERTPRFLRPLFVQVDLSGVYKHWQRFRPESFDASRREILERHESIRRFWFLRGYAGIKRASEPERVGSGAVGSGAVRSGAVRSGTRAASMER